MTLAQWIEDAQVKMKLWPYAPVDWSFPDSDGWMVTLERHFGQRKKAGYTWRDSAFEYVNTYTFPIYLGYGNRQEQHIINSSRGNNSVYQQQMRQGTVKLPERRSTPEHQYQYLVERSFGNLTRPPKLLDVLSGLRAELLVLRSVSSFEDFMTELGYDEREEAVAQQLFVSIQEREHGIRRLLFEPKIYEALLASEEDDRVEATREK